MTTPKTDFKKTYKDVYTAGPSAALVQVPELSFLKIDGVGDPSGAGYRAAVEALYAVAYTIRFALKGAGILEYPVMPLQGQWWSDTLRDFQPGGDRSRWHWTMMIMQPPQVSEDRFGQAVEAAGKKKPDAPVDRVRLEALAEGLCAQILHVGPYSGESPTVERLHAFIAESGYAIAGRHHEIYLAGPPRTEPSKMRTIIRYPVSAH